MVSPKGEVVDISDDDNDSDTISHSLMHRLCNDPISLGSIDVGMLLKAKQWYSEEYFKPYYTDIFQIVLDQDDGMFNMVIFLMFLNTEKTFRDSVRLTLNDDEEKEFFDKYVRFLEHKTHALHNTAFTKDNVMGLLRGYVDNCMTTWAYVNTREVEKFQHPINERPQNAPTISKGAAQHIPISSTGRIKQDMSPSASLPSKKKRGKGKGPMSEKAVVVSKKQNK